ncbi:CRN1 [Candida pseudojiufengensis]|uniref:CRN1 n=1 Tax=Candida pseudojiufengensis TaxID=497109 RepID=UPI002224C7CC|nr:CRN1 [Candida pseudojiufengensis]KAI5959837.1 CRN1 [Candida pseudojiufengensis]
MSGKFVRASKYRHVYGQPSKKELCYENLKITKNAWDSNIIQTNGKYISVNWDASGGGAFAIIPIEEVGKAPDTVSLFRGHKGPVLDTAFNPFNEQEVASCSDDGKILIWTIPDDYSFHSYLNEEDEVKDITEPTKILEGHSKKVGLISYHPCAENVLASSSLDYSVKIWNTKTGKDEISLKHKDLVTSFAFNYNGSLLATTSRDKKLRVWDVRKGEIISEGSGHTGAKPSRVSWLGNTDRIITTGFSRLSDRQVGIWDINNIEKGPIDGFLVVDASSGVLIPYFDEDTSILYIAGKGDGNIRYYEYENDLLYELSQYASTDPQRGFAVTPKNKVNVKENEVVKSFKTVLDNSIEPISFFVPRRSELFQSDIYPDCPSSEPALSADEWFEGKEVNGPILMTMESLFEGKKPELKNSKPVTKVSEAKEKDQKEKQEAKQKEKTEISKSTKTEATKKPEPVKEEPKNVDDVLKSSNEIGNLLNKVVDQSDDEDDQIDLDDKEEDWEEVKKSDIKSVSSSESKKDEPKSEESKKTKDEPKLEEPKKEKVESKKDDPIKKTEPKTVESKEQKPKEKDTPTEISEPVQIEQISKEAIKPLDSKTQSTSKEESSPSTNTSTTTKPTLGSTIEKLSNLVIKLESQVTKLTESGLEKDERLKSLEEKIEKLLNRS